PIGRDRGCGTKAALEVDGGGRGAGPDAPEREIEGRVRGRRVGELAIRRKAAPVLVTAVEQIEQDRARYDRNPRRTNLVAAALLAQKSLRAARGVEPIRRAARQRDRVDARDRHLRIE